MSDSVSTARLVSPSFCEVHFSDVITPGEEDEVGHSLVNEEKEEKQTDESPWDRCHTKNRITSESVR